MPFVYVLTLKGGKKYIGYSNNIQKRISQHFSGTGAEWTKKHKPMSVNKVIYCPTIEYAKKLETTLYYNFKNYYGTEKVRGAGYTKSY